MYQKRFYREQLRKNDLEYFGLKIKETDLYIGVTKVNDQLKSAAENKLAVLRAYLEAYIKANPLFEMTFKPIPIDREAPEVVRRMSIAAAKAGVGPMASVAGCLAEMIGEELQRYSPEVIVENGGDIFIKTSKSRDIGIYAGSSKFSGKLILEIEPRETPLGLCTSSGTVGHSVSLGKADACLVKCSSAALADAYASALGNMIRSKEDLPEALESAAKLEGLRGVLIIIDNELATWGDIVLCSPTPVSTA